MKAGPLWQTGHFEIWVRKSGTPSILVPPVLHYFTNTPHAYVATCLCSCALKMGLSFTQRVNSNIDSLPVTWHSGTLVQPLLKRKRNMCYIPWVCVCSLRYPACNARAPYFHLWTVRFYNIFPNYLSKRHDFRKKNIGTKKCVFSFSLQHLSETFLILGRTERDMNKNIYWASCKVPFILFRFWWNLHFLDRSSKNTQISNFMKFCPLGARSFHADGRTDGHDADNSRFSQFLILILVLIYLSTAIGLTPGDSTHLHINNT
jgi:hypothetical protein